MTSTAYKLVSNYGLKPLGPHGWLHSLKTGQIVIPNPNEKGEKGSILDLFLAADRQRWPRIIGKVENEGFLPDPLHEELVIWLMEKGANPWIRHEGETPGRRPSTEGGLLLCVIFVLDLTLRPRGFWSRRSFIGTIAGILKEGSLQ